MLIWHPEHQGNGQRINALTTAVDINATILELTGAEDFNNGPHGKSLLPLLRGETATHRDWVLTGTFGDGVTITTPEWRLAQGIRGGLPMASYSTTSYPCDEQMTSGHFIPGVAIPQWRVPFISQHHDDYLWQRQPFTLTPENVLEKQPQQTKVMRDIMREAITSIPGPPEMLGLLGLRKCEE